MSVAPGFYFCDLGGMPYYFEKAAKHGRWARFNVIQVDEYGDAYCVGSEVPAKAPESLPSGWLPIEMPPIEAGHDPGKCGIEARREP